MMPTVRPFPVAAPPAHAVISRSVTPERVFVRQPGSRDATLVLGELGTATHHGTLGGTVLHVRVLLDSGRAVSAAPREVHPARYLDALLALVRP